MEVLIHNYGKLFNPQVTGILSSLTITLNDAMTNLEKLAILY